MDTHLTHSMLITVVIAIAGGVFAIALSRKLDLSAIVILLLLGMGLGPAIGWGIVDPQSLGNGLSVLISLAVGVILFEGGLTLDVSGYRSAPTLIRRLLSIGVLVTWLGVALAIGLIFRPGMPTSLLAASLVIVTGPTVIGPLLKRIKVNTQLHNILHWEGVLIDPIGVFVALLCFEWVTGAAGETVLANFILRLLGGLVIGVAGGLIVYGMMRYRLVPEEMLNLFALASAVFIFGLTELWISEGGLLAVTVAGLVLGWLRPVELEQIRRFKGEITDLLIGMLFILLAANLEPQQFIDFGWRGALVVAVVMLVVRPLNILCCSRGLDMGWREKVFLGWVAPRGIVAASMASLFAIELSNQRTPMISDPKFIETFTYSVIMATVLVQGFTAGPLAALLRLKRPKPTGWMILGAHLLARRIARFLAAETELPILLVDRNAKLVSEAKAEGLEVLRIDARHKDLEEAAEMRGMGNLLALTDNEELNQLACQRLSRQLGRDQVRRWSSEGEIEQRDPTQGLPIWSHLPKPSLLSAELEGHEASSVRLTRPLAELDELTVPLIGVKDKIVCPDPTPDDEEAVKGFTRLLCLRRQADYLIRSLREELIVRLDVKSMSDLLAVLVDRLVDKLPQIPRQATLTELLDREKAFPTSLGHGIAAPHAYSKAIKSRICAVAQVPGGIDLDAADGEPVRLVFLMLSPAGDPEGHLATLAEIARLQLDEETRGCLMQAPAPREFLQIIRDYKPH